MKVGDVVYFGKNDERYYGTVVDIDRRPGYGRIIFDSVEFALPEPQVKRLAARRADDYQAQGQPARVG